MRILRLARAEDLLDYDIFTARVTFLSARITLLSIGICVPLKFARRVANEQAEHFRLLLEQADDEIASGNTYRRWYRTKTAALVDAKNNASSLERYASATKELDQHQGHDHWKASRFSIEPDYRPDVIETQIDNMRHAIRSESVEQLRLVLRSSLDRRLGGMDNIRLYKHSWFGTKDLVDIFNITTVAAIDTLVRLMSAPDTPISEIVACRETLQEAVKYHGRTSLSLSGGARLGMSHIGVAKCLAECNLLPEIISGTSAGSIVAAVIATRTPDEMEETLSRFPKSNLAVFDQADSRPGTIAWCYRRLWTFWKTGSFFDSKYLREVMREEWLSDLTFQEAYNKTQTVLNITVSKAATAEPVILNHKTAPNVLIWSAVCASCAVPYRVFPAASIYERLPDTKEIRLWMEDTQSPTPYTYVDGSLDHDIPVQKLKEQFHVSWTIVTQTNPHVRPFLTGEEEFFGTQPTTSEAHPGYLKILKIFGYSVTIHTLQILASLGFPPVIWRWGAILTQQYSGNINIFPSYKLSEVCSMVTNPTPEFMRAATREGERATWPKMTRIKNSLMIELALQRAIRELDVLIHFPEDMPEDRLRDLRRRSRSCRPPSFLRSVSSEVHRHRRTLTGPGAMIMVNDYAETRPLRRNRSLGSIHGFPSLQGIREASAQSPTVLAPQKGVNRFTLMMTPLDAPA